MREGLLCEELLHEIVIDFGDCFVDVVHQFVDVSVGIRHGHLCGLSVRICVSFVLQQVHEDRGLAFLDNGQDYRADSGAEVIFEILECLSEVSVLNACASHEEHDGALVVLGEFECLLCADADSASCGKDNGNTFCCLNALIHSQFEIEQAGSVEEIHLDSVVLQRSDCERDGCLAADLFIFEVHDCRSGCYGTETVRGLGEEQKRFGK